MRQTPFITRYAELTAAIYNVTEEPMYVWTFTSYARLLSNEQLRIVAEFWNENSEEDWCVGVILHDIVGLAEGGEHFLPKIQGLQ